VLITSPVDGTNTTGGCQTPVTGNITSTLAASWEMDYQQVTTDNGYVTGNWTPFAADRSTGPARRRT